MPSKYELWIPGTGQWMLPQLTKEKTHCFQRLLTEKLNEASYLKKKILSTKMFYQHIPSLEKKSCNLIHAPPLNL